MTTRAYPKWIIGGGVLLLLVIFATLFATAPRHPMALIRVVDAAGKPIAGATVQPEGLRTKPGPYVSGWYGWPAESGVSNPPVTTDAAGCASVPYPKFVFERIETGTLCLAVTHPDFVPDRPERVVASAPPAGAPWKVRLLDLYDRVRHKALITHADPVVLQPGAGLTISVPPDPAWPTDLQIFAQVSGEPYNAKEFWVHPDPRTVVTRRLGAGTHRARAIGIDRTGGVWFSEAAAINAVAGDTNELRLGFRRGITIHGTLDQTVPRPVRNGRVVAHVTPQGAKLEDSPPQWHDWTRVNEDGSFTVSSLPEGDLEITAMCDGFVSTNGPGKFHMRYPQRHLLGTNDLTIGIGMEATARLEVKVTDAAGQPLQGVRVATWPNVRYGEWSATILMSDCYRTADALQSKLDSASLWGRGAPDFEGVSDATGLAVLANLPADTTELATDHPQFELPAVADSSGQKRRQSQFTLAAGRTNQLTIRLEPRDQSVISHY